ncbi:MAG: sulfite exporter TauE/SafE family protein [Bdellovibrionaceae bacterium]|nr:sulfite exporter TauE/SafE family protein [Pseudobdellovibrionaceae bacterium]
MDAALGYTASLIMGITLGLVGGGGSILTVPIMVYLFHLSPTMATGHSLFIVGVTALTGSLMYIRKGHVDFNTGFLFAIPSVVGVNISRGLILPKIPETLIHIQGFILTKDILVMIAFATLMLVASYAMIKKRDEPKKNEIKPLTRSLLLSSQGLIVGLIAGFVGAGGGFLIIPALVFFARLPMKVAVGTSLLIIATQSLLGFAGDLARGFTVQWPLLSIVASIAIVGIVAGSSIAHKIQEQKLKIAFGWFVFLMGLTITIEQFYRLSL